MLTFAVPPWMNLPVATDLSAVPGDWIVSCFAEMNLPVELDLIEVLLLLGLDLVPRNFSSPIPLGDDLVLPLFTSTTSLTTF